MVSGKKKITVIGSLNIDLIKNIDRMPFAGETIFGKDFQICFGGKGANQCVVCKKLEADVNIIGKIGDDMFGREILRNFKEMGINTDHITIEPNVCNGVATVFVDNTGQNRIIVVKGANDYLTEKDIDNAKDVIYSSSYVLLQLEIPIRTVEHTINMCYEKNIKVILNPAPAQTINPTILNKTYLFIPNEIEAGQITGMDISNVDNIINCAKHLNSMGLKRVLITMGEKGVIFAKDNEIEHIKGIKVKTVDTSGAGDAFIGSLAVFLSEGNNLKNAIIMANKYAALTTTRKGTQSSFLNKAEFESALKNIAST